MQKVSRVLLVVSLLVFTSLSAQVYSIDNFDSSATNGLYIENVEGPPSYIGMSDNHTDFVEGNGSMDVNYVMGEFNLWGTYANMIYRTDSTETLDWTVSDSLSIWIKVHEAATHPEYMVMRIHIADQPDPGDPIEEYIYENLVVFDTQADWFELKIPFYERPQNGAGDLVPNDSGFILFPTSWGGGTYNNRQLDRDKIIGYNLSAVVSGYDPNQNLPADSVKISFDNFTRFGSRAVPFIVFNGIAVGSNLVNTWAWGQSSIAVMEDSGATPGTNALKWTQGDEYGNGWTGFGFDVSPPQNMLGSWMTDSVKFKMKAGDSTGALRMQFESGAGAGKVGLVFTPTPDNQWHDYAFALRDFTFQDGTTAIDTAAITTVGLMAEASGVAGNVVYIDDWWTGNPDFDVIAPNPPSPVIVSAGTFANSVSWLDPEAGATYNIYYSESPITDVNAAGVQWAGSISQTPPSVFDHALKSPVGDSLVSYYYAVTATDAAGNVSDPATTSSATTNTAKGIVTISLNAPSSFAADGNLSEWSGVAPIHLLPSEGAHIVTNTTVNGDGDLSVLTYFAVDNNYLYLAFDVTDDILDTASVNSWEKDSPDLFLGLYDWHSGKPHGSYLRGSEPDYHFRFNHNQAILDNLGSAVILDISSPDYSWTPSFPTGYVIEARISWADLAAVGGDNVFVPVEGYKIPLDLAINDADGGGVREGIMTLSPLNEDNSYQSPSFWTYTWAGNRFNPIVGIDDEPQSMIFTYDLGQNYPNPFNPTTNITYTLAKQSYVELDVYNTLGQKVQSLIQKRQAPGVYYVQFDARNLASGIYFYRLKADDFVKIRKMVLMK